MKGDIDDALQPQPVERLGERRPDAFQRGDLGEQRIEDGGTHDYMTPLAYPTDAVSIRRAVRIG